MHRTIHFGIGSSFQITNILPSLTAFENIQLAAQALGNDNLKFSSSAVHFNPDATDTWAVI